MEIKTSKAKIAEEEGHVFIFDDSEGLEENVYAEALAMQATLMESAMLDEHVFDVNDM